MADTIQVTYKVMEDGTLKRIGQDAEKAAKSTDKASRSSDNYSKRNKGVAGATSNSTKAFSKMTTGIEGGLVPAYATLAAHVFAVTAAFGVLSRAAAVRQLNEGLLFTGRAAGQNLPIVVDNLRKITENAVSSADAMRAVAIGTSAGFDQTQMEGLTRVAKGASLALGRDMTDALDRLTRGAAKLEPEILDELGIMVRLDDATEKFAATLGKSVGDLTQFERRMAFTNAIIEQGEQKFGALSQSVEANPFNKLAATFDNLIKSVTNFFNIVVGPIAGYLADNLPALIASVGILGTGVVNKMVPGLLGAGEAARDMAKDMADGAKSAIANTKAFKGAPRAYSGLIDKIKEGTASSKEYDDAVTSLEKSIRAHKNQMPGFIAQYGEGSEEVATKTAKLNEAEKAHKSLTGAQALETQATRKGAQADIMAAAAAGNLRATYTLLKAEILANFAATKLDTAGKGILATAYAYLRTTITMATLSVKAFGLALLQSIPLIGQVIMVGMLLWEAFKWLFKSDAEETVSPLADAIEDSRKRVEEYPNIIEQLADSYDMATSSAERYIIALKVQNGLIGQGLSSVQSLARAEEVANRKKEIAARRTLEQQKKAVEESEKLLTKAGVELPEDGKFSFGQRAKANIAGHVFFEGVDPAEVRAAMDAYEQGLAGISSANEALGKVLSASPTDELLAETQISLEENIVALTAAQSKLQEGSDEFNQYGNSINTVRSLLANLTKDNLKETIDELVKLKTTVAATENSFKSLADVQAEMDAKLAENKNATGLFAFEITQLDNALKALEGTNRSKAQLDEFLKTVESLGVASEQAGKDLLVLLKGLNEGDMKAATAAAEAAHQALVLQKAGLDIRVKENEFNTASAEATRLSDEYEQAKLMKTVSANELEKMKLEVQKAQTEELKKQLALSKALVDDAERTGGEQFATGIQVGTFFKDNADVLGSDDVATSDKIRVMGEGLNPMFEQLKKLGPEGELTAAVVEGGLLMAESFAGAFKKMEDNTFGLQDGLAMAATAVNALGSIQQAQAKAGIKAIDDQIKAEQARDGKSAASVAKLKALEEKKTAMQRKAFEQNKKMQMAQTIISTSSAIMSVMDDVPPPFNFILAGLVGAMGAMQLSTIAGTSFQGGGSISSAPSSVEVGKRKNVVDLAKGQNAAGELAYARGASGAGNMTNFRPAFSGYKHRADGGYVVGEQGPELFMPQVPGTIIPAGETEEIAAQSPVNVNFTIQTIDSQNMEEALMTQRASIISMIREAANANGEDFLQSVDLTEANY